MQLQTYVRKLKNGKVKDADAEHEISEKLQKLEEIWRTWPKLIPPRVKEKLVGDFKEATSS